MITRLAHILYLLPLLLPACTVPDLPQNEADPLATFVSREDFLQRLEPRGNRILHGAGANPQDFADYWNELERTPPALYATHLDLMYLREDWPLYIREVLDYYPAYIIPQIALSMNHEGVPYEDRVAAGELDAQIDLLAWGIARLGRPVFIRIGYGFNSPATGYRPAPYKRAWERIVETLRIRHRLKDVATVWCYFADAPPGEIARFYPGDEYVDWWGIDLFDPRNFRSPTTREFMETARQRGFPVMIGEAAPRGPGIEPDTHMWERWFVPFFRFIRSHPNVKAFCYISWLTGDTRIGADLDVLMRYRDELDDDLYLHATTAEELRWQLEMEP